MKATWTGKYIIKDNTTGEIIETDKTETDNPMVKPVEPTEEPISILKKTSE